MILLVSSSPAAAKAAAILREQLGEVHTSDGLQQARAITRSHPIDAVILDESSLDLEATRVDALSPEGAVAVVANLVIHNPQRIARMVTQAMRRREHERASAMNSAARLLRSELQSELTGILLATRQALEAPELPAPAEHKLRLVCDAAERIRERLGS
jgi:hypothetical protein